MTKKELKKSKLYDDAITIVDYLRATMAKWAFRDALCEATGIERNDFNLAIRYLKEIKLVDEKKKDGEPIIIYKEPKL